MDNSTFIPIAQLILFGIGSLVVIGYCIQFEFEHGAWIDAKEIPDEVFEEVKIDHRKDLQTEPVVTLKMSDKSIDITIK